MYSSVSGTAMRSAQQHPPVILLLGERTGKHDYFREWLAASRYSAFEASDVFQALEHVSDFTIRERPDVIYLHLDSIAADRDFMQTLVATGVGEPDVPIIDFGSVFPKDESDRDFEQALAGLAHQLDELIPHHDRAPRAA
jgi:hypothetical protein